MEHSGRIVGIEALFLRVDFDYRYLLYQMAVMLLTIRFGSVKG